MCVLEKQKYELQTVLELDACACSKWPYKKTVAATARHQTLATYAVNIYYQINAKKSFSHVFGRRPPSLTVWHASRMCMRLAISEVICVTSTNFTVGDW